MRPCGHDGPVDSCRVCRLYLSDPRYRRLWGGEGPVKTPPAESSRARGLPCFHLGRVLDRAGCNCLLRHVRSCELHGTTTLLQCRSCPDYEPDG